uniref:Ion_trans domain-containing protein n=1 Tax=Caenorhabditis tropicalis TaxID=1561998 RepID=A0A1I7UCW5_9PELO
MKNFLSINRLENLYNMDDVNSAHSVRNWMENYDSMDPHTYLTIPMIGQVVEKLMGNAFQLYYTSRNFKAKYDRYKRMNQSSYFYRKRKIVQKELFKKKSDDQMDENFEEDFSFAYPFNDLLIWAVLTSRHDMAKCMWIHGEDAMAKCLVAIRLYKATAKIAEDEYLDVEEAKRLFDNAVKCREDAIELVDQCYRADHDKTLRLLRMELPHWSNNNCLSLAVLANTKTFLAHPCCQILLAELWHGSLKVRSGSNIRVLTALICPPAILFMAYKPKHSKTARLLSEETQEDIPYPRESITSTTSNRYRYPKGVEEQKETLLEKGNYAKKVTIISSRKNSGVASVYGSASSMMFKREPQLNKFERFRAFYSAPITKFWSWCIAFLIFLTTQTCILLLETSLKPSKYEWITLIYTVTLSVEHMRKLLTSEGSRINEKIKVFYAKWYNIWTSAALLFFFVGYGFRLVPMYRHSWGRVLLSCSNVLFYMKTFEYLSVHPLLGPYIQMAAKMVWSMCYICVLLLVPLMAFGVNRQALSRPNIKDWNWLLVRNIFYKPYFMLYGEVYAGEIDSCGDEGMHCYPGYFIPPLLMVVFLLVANILLLNLLIAIFNNIYNDSIEKSKEIWLFQRYQQLMEYHDSPFLPPPFSIFAHVYHFIVYIYNSRVYDIETKIDHISNSSDEVVQILNKKKVSQNIAASSLSLPETSIEVPKFTKPIIDFHLSPVVIEDRLATRSPLLANLHRDHTLRKYDDANFQAANLQRRTRLHSSSCSISQDMKEMKTSASARNLRRQNSEETTSSSHGGYDSDVSGHD